jgi:hypothetical protein
LLYASEETRAVERRQEKSQLLLAHRVVPHLLAFNDGIPIVRLRLDEASWSMAHSGDHATRGPLLFEEGDDGWVRVQIKNSAVTTCKTEYWTARLMRYMTMTPRRLPTRNALLHIHTLRPLLNQNPRNSSTNTSKTPANLSICLLPRIQKLCIERACISGKLKRQQILS